MSLPPFLWESKKTHVMVYRWQVDVGGGSAAAPTATWAPRKDGQARIERST
jgi:hypothetical protein